MELKLGSKCCSTSGNQSRLKEVREDGHVKS